MRVVFIQVLLAWMFLVLLNSCSTSYYSPSVAVSPELKEKNDIVINGFLISSGSGGGSTELSYSPLSNIGVLFRKSGYSKEYERVLLEAPFTIESRKIKHSTFDTGIGWYGNFKNSLHLRTYATVGRGNFRDDLFRGSYYRMGVHPSIIFQMNKIFELGIHGSFLKLSYNEPLFDLEIDNISQYAYLRENNEHVIMELFLSALTHLDHFDITYQIALSENVNNPDFNQENSSVSIGLVFDLNKIFKGRFLKKKN